MKNCMALEREEKVTWVSIDRERLRSMLGKVEEALNPKVAFSWDQTKMAKEAIEETNRCLRDIRYELEVGILSENT